MTLPLLENLDTSGKRVLVRMDLDVAEDFSRVQLGLQTLKHLRGAKLIIVGHRGRPEGKPSKELSLEPIAQHLSSLLGKKVNFVSDIVGQEAKDKVAALVPGEILMLENLRFDPGEEENNQEFAAALASLAEGYVNEAFAVSHRAHASIVGVPQHLPHAAGLRFAGEVEKLTKVLENPQRPVVALISGIKKDKVEMAKTLSQKVDKVLVGGRLPEFFGDNTDSVRAQNDSKLIIANLNMDKEDITLNSIDRFKREIASAGTIILAGVLGRYEDAGHRQGTEEIFRAVADAKAFKIAGGGDTEAALTQLGLTQKFDWISVGGGAMLEFLAKGTLPGIEALLE